MTGCCADGCTNSTKKGFQMCKVPVESKRRKIWIDKINRPGWIAGPGAALCDTHFEESMWEIYQGRRRLKRNAFPTLFNNSSISTGASQSSTYEEASRTNLMTFDEQSNVDEQGPSHKEVIVSVDTMTFNDTASVQRPALEELSKSDMIIFDKCTSLEKGIGNLQLQVDHGVTTSLLEIPNSDSHHLVIRTEKANNHLVFEPTLQAVGCSADNTQDTLIDIQNRLILLEKLYKKSEQSRILLKKKLDAAMKILR